MNIHFAVFCAIIKAVLLTIEETTILDRVSNEGWTTFRSDVLVVTG